jgi:ATP-dependent RNA helicase RhlE
MPRAVEDYVHRVGRTGRAGAEGRALSLVAPTERRTHKAVVEHLRRTSGKGGGAPSDNGQANDEQPRPRKRRRRTGAAMARSGARKP